MAKVFTGSKASFKINGVKVAFASSITINQTNQLTRVDVLDQLESAELAETGHEVNCTVNLFKVDENALALFGLDPSDINSLLTQPELTIEVYDRVNDQVQYTILGAKFEAGNGSVDARGIFSGSWSFQGRIGRGL